jgi:hypothetical protein
VWLGALLPGRIEIPDPYLLKDEDAERVLRRMTEAADHLIEAIEVLAVENCCMGKSEQDPALKQRYEGAFTLD